MSRVIGFLILASVLLFGGNLGVSYKGSSDYNLIRSITQNSNFLIEQTNGDLQNLKMIFKSKNIKSAVVQEDIVKDLVFENPKLKSSLKILTPLYQAPVVIITKKDAPIESFKDLANLPVAVDVEGSGDYYTFLKLQERYLVVPEVYNIKKSEYFEYLDDSKVAAIFYIGRIKDIKSKEKYKFIPLKDGDFASKNFYIDNNRTIKLSYLNKYLISSTDKADSISNGDLNRLIRNLIAGSNRKTLCSYDLDSTPVLSLKNLYLVCSQTIPAKIKKHDFNLKTDKDIGVVRENKKQNKLKTEKIYFDNLEDIIIYPEALKKSGFSNYITSNNVEKMKFENVVKLIKNELKSDKDVKIVIESKGNSNDSVKNVDYIYKKLKRYKIPRGNLIKKVLNIDCANECFSKTTIRFKLL